MTAQSQNLRVLLDFGLTQDVAQVVMHTLPRTTSQHEDVAMVLRSIAHVPGRPAVC